MGWDGMGWDPKQQQRLCEELDSKIQPEAIGSDTIRSDMCGGMQWNGIGIIRWASKWGGDLAQFGLAWMDHTQNRMEENDHPALRTY